MTDADKTDAGIAEEQPAEDEETAAYLERLQDAASTKYCSYTNDIAVDPLTADDISEADKGVWVRGWLWLSSVDDLGEPEDDDDC